MKALWCAAAIVACLAPGVRADEWNKKTILTFSGPVQIPGVTLPPGSYVFKLADLSGNRHVVQVFDKDEKQIYATILAIPDQRLEPSDKPVVLFAERLAGVPTAVKAWFYPGETIGNEFAYPKEQAMRIAREAHQSVLAMDDTSTATTTDAERMASMKSAKLTRIDESGTTTDVSTTTAQTATTTTETATSTTTTAPVAAPAPTTAAPVTEPATTTAEAAPAPTVAAPPASSTASAVTPSEQPVRTSGRAATAPSDRRSLPRTAGNMTLIQLLAAVSLTGGLGIRRLRARLANVK